MPFTTLLRRILAGAWALGFGAYLVHGLITDTSLIGWLEYAQQSVMGSYSMKLTAVVAMILWAVPIAVLVPRANTALQRSANAPVTTRGVAAVAIASLALVWIGGYAIRSWTIYQDTQDYEASYPELRLESGKPVTLPSDHLALLGNALTDATVSFEKNGLVSYYLVPVVPADWRPGQPVSVVVRAKTAQLNEPPRFDPAARRVVQGSAVVLARSAGEVSVPAAQEFARMGLELTQPHYQLERIPSQEGKPIAPDHQTNEWAFLLVAGFLSFLIVLFSVVIAVKQREQQPAASQLSA